MPALWLPHVLSRLAFHYVSENWTHNELQSLILIRDNYEGQRHAIIIYELYKKWFIMSIKMRLWNQYENDMNPTCLYVKTSISQISDDLLLHIQLI